MSVDGVVQHDRGPRVVVGLVGVAGLAALGFGATVLGIALVLAALGGGVATSVGPALTRRSTRMADIVVPRWTGADAQALATDQRRLTARLGDADQVAEVVRPQLAALVDDRLRRRGVQPGSAEADVLLGDELAAFLAGGTRRAVSAGAFGALLDRVEAL